MRAWPQLFFSLAGSCRGPRDSFNFQGQLKTCVYRNDIDKKYSKKDFSSFYGTDFYIIYFLILKSVFCQVYFYSVVHVCYHGQDRVVYTIHHLT